MSRPVQVILMVLAFACSAWAADPPELTSARQAYDSGDFRQSLVAITAAFKQIDPRYKPDADQPDVRSSLYSLRGECHLKLGNRADSMEAFKTALTYATTDDQRISSASTLWLIQSSPKLAYPPAGEAQVNITDPANRPQALNALFEDRLKALQRDIDAAAKASSPTKAKELLPKFTDLLVLEKSAGSNEGRTLAASEPIAKRCAAFVADACASAAARVEANRKSAATEVWEQFVQDGTLYKYKTQRGLDSREKEEMKQLVDSLRDTKKFILAWHELNPDPKAADAWSESVGQLDQVLGGAEGVLKKQWHRRRAR